MPGPEELYQLALKAEPTAALSLLRQLLKASPDFPNAAYRLGMMLHAQGEITEAEKAYRDELLRWPDFWACRANLAQLLLETDRYEEALHESSTACSDCPWPEQQAGILQLQAHLHRRLGQLSLAKTCLQEAQELADSATLQRDSARLLLQLGETAAAGRHYRRALVLGANPLLQREAAEHLMSVQQFPEAIAVLEGVLTKEDLTQAEQAIVRGQIANAWQELNQPLRALAGYEHAIQLQARDSLRLAQALVLPMVYQSQPEVAFWRQQLEAGLHSLRHRQLKDPLELGVMPFYAPYQGYNDRQLMEDFAACFGPDLPADEPGCFERKKSHTLRVGCVSHFFYDHSVMRCFADLLLELQKPPFELHCFAASPLFEDALTERMRKGSSSWTRLQGGIKAQIEQIRLREPDVLIYTDMGLDPHCYLLARHRLAPLQILLPGQPVTSGLKTFDGFVSDLYSEPPNASSHYTEPLLRMNQLPSIYPFPQLPARLRSRNELGLPEGRLYVCPSQAFKLHPAMDQALIQILQQDSQAQLLLLDLTPNGLIQHVRHRLMKRTRRSESSRIHVLPRLDAGAFLALLSAVDVMLESFPFSSYNTLLAAFAVGTPVITLPGLFLRGRYCLGLYRQMGIENPPIADSADEYTRLAIELAQDTQKQKYLRRQILSARPKIFNNGSVGEEFRQLLLSLLQL